MRKEQERAELHRTIWKIANGLRGSVDGWDFKQYVLGMLFYRYISENLAAYLAQDEDETFDYATLLDADAEAARAGIVQEKGFFIPPSHLFHNVHARAAHDENLNETLAAVFRGIEVSSQGQPSEADFKGLFADFDVNSPKLGNSVAERNARLVMLMDGVAEMRLGDYQNNTIDAFGDAYEFLMGMYASDAGKSGGEFFTPQEVSELLTRIATHGKTSANKIYDPACGSGSLLLKAIKVLGKDNVRQGFYGQEINLTTYNLCRINMFLHDVDYDRFDIALGDTLTDPKHWDDEPFEVIVSNPPYSIKWPGKKNPTLINDERYAPAGILAPSSKADFAFILHCWAWLAETGVAAIVCFPGVFYRDDAEGKIRKWLVNENAIEAVIQLPNKLFFGTDTATCILVLSKAKRDNSVLFLDASKDYVKATNNNKLTDDNITAILRDWSARKDIPNRAVLVPLEAIEAQGYNLSVSTYVRPQETCEAIDIHALEADLADIVARQSDLRAEIDAIIADLRAEVF